MPPSFRQFSFAFIFAALIAGLSIPCTLSAQDTSDPFGPDDPAVTALPIMVPAVEHNFPITTSSPEAQELFNAGLRLAYQMQPLEAFATFVEASEVDPECGMCYWGAALVLGPNLRTPMDPINTAQAYELSQKALSLSQMVSGIEEDLITALATRYAPDSTAGRDDLDQAYSEAMRTVARKYPQNDDVLTLLAAALMNERRQIAKKPPAELPQPREILDILQEALALNPDNPGANQFYDEILKATAAENAATN